MGLLTLFRLSAKFRISSAKLAAESSLNWSPRVSVFEWFSSKDDDGVHCAGRFGWKCPSYRSHHRIELFKISDPALKLVSALTVQIRFVHISLDSGLFGTMWVRDLFDGISFGRPYGLFVATTKNENKSGDSTFWFWTSDTVRNLVSPVYFHLHESISRPYLFI